jgi:predicted metal-dependent hydrolase
MSENYFYGQFMSEHLVKIKEGLRLYNIKKFWECHEELEDHWLEDTGDNARLIYWAVIQGAAAMYHLRGENMVGVHGMLKKAKNKIERIDQHKVETDVLNDGFNWQAFRELIEQAPLDGSPDQYQSLYDFQFIYGGEKLV